MNNTKLNFILRKRVELDRNFNAVEEEAFELRALIKSQDIYITDVNRGDNIEEMLDFDNLYDLLSMQLDEHEYNLISSYLSKGNSYYFYDKEFICK